LRRLVIACNEKARGRGKERIHQFPLRGAWSEQLHRCGPRCHTLRALDLYKLTQNRRQGRLRVWGKLFQVFLRTMRIPTKPAMHSNLKPATCSDPKPAGVPI
jgi:hypothetical protein